MVALTDGTAFFLTVALTVLVFIRHAGNIRRIKRGEEPKIGRK